MIMDSAKNNQNDGSSRRSIDGPNFQRDQAAWLSLQNASFVDVAAAENLLDPLEESQLWIASMFANSNLPNPSLMFTYPNVHPRQTGFLARAVDAPYDPFSNSELAPCSQAQSYPTPESVLDAPMHWFDAHTDANNHNDHRISTFNSGEVEGHPDFDKLQHQSEQTALEAARHRILKDAEKAPDRWAFVGQSHAGNPQSSRPGDNSYQIYGRSLQKHRQLDFDHGKQSVEPVMSHSKETGNKMAIGFVPSTTSGPTIRTCKCKKSGCIKLYCDCFKGSEYCLDSCKCVNCLNRKENDDTIQEIRELVESRDANAFEPKIARANTSPRIMGYEGLTTPMPARHKKGCKCKKSACVKRYCECYQAGVGCYQGCKCEDCKNSFGKKPDLSEAQYLVNPNPQPHLPPQAQLMAYPLPESAGPSASHSNNIPNHPHPVYTGSNPVQHQQPNPLPQLEGFQILSERYSAFPSSLNMKSFQR